MPLQEVFDLKNKIATDTVVLNENTLIKLFFVHKALLTQ